MLNNPEAVSTAKHFDNGGKNNRLEVILLHLLTKCLLFGYMKVFCYRPMPKRFYSTQFFHKLIELIRKSDIISWELFQISFCYYGI